MTLSAGSRLGPFEILAPLGAGGMGEVYRARDTRLDRVVAIKVLPAHLSGSAEFRQRFEREARAASSLNHPHICTLHDIGSQDGVDYLVMECLEGETLASRVGKGPLPLHELLRCAVEIGDALAKAHRQGLVHRDLKPGNVMLTKSGAKLLDFGLAKNAAPTRAEAGMTGLNTMTSPLTAEGAIVGTFQYMAPEQLEGGEADARSDIFAFGLVLYEMATGRRAFGGKTQASLIAAILKEEPRSISEIQPLTPPALERLVRTCLTKDPDERRQSMQDVVLELRWIAGAGPPAGAAESSPSSRPRRARGERIWIGIASILFLSCLGLGILHFGGPRPVARVVNASIAPPEGTNFEFVNPDDGPPVLSPDGRRLAFSARGKDGRTSLWTRALDAPAAQPLAGTDGAASPFWSADGRSLGFFANGKLMRVVATGGPPITICNAFSGRGGTWNTDGVILFAPDRTSPIHRVAAAGGVSSPLTKLDGTGGNESHRWPHFLPDGRHFLFMARIVKGDGRTTWIRVGSLDSDRSEPLIEVESNAVYASGHLLFMRETTLMAQPFDLSSLELTGDPAPIAERVQWDAGSGRGVFTAAGDGTLVYQTGEAQTGSRLFWYDRDGRQRDPVGQRALLYDIALSPDGRSIALSITDPQIGPPDLWIHDLSRGLRTRFTFDWGGDRRPVWSPDSARIVYRANQSVMYELRAKSLSGSETEQVLLESPVDRYPTSWSPDGRHILFAAIDPSTRSDLWVLALSGEPKPAPFLVTSFNEGEGQFSPDGRWIAYASDESGRDEIYVAPFPGPGRKWQVSVAGGDLPRWRRDGREIFYLSRERKLMAAAVSDRDTTFDVGDVKPLFDVSYTGVGTIYDVSPDGQRFLVNTSVRQTDPTPLTLLLNWTAGLGR